jgi:uncharacterized protein
MRYFLINLLLLFSLGLQAKEVPPRPYPPRLVNDFAGLLGAGEADALERKLVAYNDSTSTQIAIVIDESLEGDDPFDYSLRIATEWGIGQKDKDNGLLIYIAVKERKFGFQTGYGVEGFLPDAMAKRIIQNVIVPAFREGRFYEGLDRATDAVIELAAGEYEADERGPRDAKGGVPAVLILVFIIILIVVISSMGGGHGDDDDDDGGYYRGGRYDMDPRRRRRRSGGWIFFPGGFGGGGGGFGGGGGGGFGGFGGGGFGGGGSFGDW